MHGIIPVLEDGFNLANCVDVRITDVNIRERIVTRFSKHYATMMTQGVMQEPSTCTESPVDTIE